MATGRYYEDLVNLIQEGENDMDARIRMQTGRSGMRPVQWSYIGKREKPARFLTASNLIGADAGD